MEEVIRPVIMLGALLVAVILHEMAHAGSAWLLGDPTGKHQNRLSFNPIHHIDPWMTILLPVMLYFGTGGRFVFGGAKPVPINPFNFRNPGRDMMLSAAAGPGSNIVQALLAFGIFGLALLIFPGAVAPQDADGNLLGLTWNGFFLFYFAYINIVLAAFNLVPIPPLDGSRILRYLLPQPGKEFLDRIEPYGLFILILFLAMNLLNHVLYPVVVFFIMVMDNMFGSEITVEFLKMLSKG